ncbi:MAG TPA: nucleoside triphosphate pyrophosphatase [Rhizomicrobium sp.]|nr:nucleoside triphosphate pyrophosphatase [Rhizomicrobium sp.]
MRLILASASTVRAAMLANAGVPHEVMPAHVDEDATKERLLAERKDMAAIADALAELKALDISAKHPRALVLGADQVLAFEGRLLSKARSLREAREILSELRGRHHELLSAAVLAKDGRAIWRHVGRAVLHMRDFSNAFLDDYIAREGHDLLQGVGCYRIEGRGVQLFERIEGDNFTIQGLPLLPLLEALRAQGIVMS